MKIVLALVLVACVAVQAAPARNGTEDGAAKKVKGVCRRLVTYAVCPLNAKGKADLPHCKGVKVCGGKGKWEKLGDDDGEDGAAKKVKGACLRMAWYWFCPLNAKGKVDYKTCYRVKECGGGFKGEWKKDGDDGHEHFEPAPGEDDGDHKHKCKKHHKTGDDDDDEDGDHKHKHKCKHGDESGDESDGDDDDDDDEDGDKKKKRKCKKKHGSDGEDSDGSGDSGSDSDHKHGCKKHGSDDSGDDSD